MITTEEAKNRSTIIKALAHPTRIMMVEFLKTGEKSFSEISKLFNLDKSTISKHLLILKNVGILNSQKKGWDMIYSLETPCITDFFSCVSAVMKQSNKKDTACLCKL